MGAIVALPSVQQYDNKQHRKKAYYTKSKQRSLKMPCFSRKSPDFRIQIGEIMRKKPTIWGR
jgi:hypothetical protein